VGRVLDKKKGCGVFCGECFKYLKSQKKNHGEYFKFFKISVKKIISFTSSSNKGHKAWTALAMGAGLWAEYVTRKKPRRIFQIFNISKKKPRSIFKFLKLAFKNLMSIYKFL
jgi:hypothetical protein